MTLAQVVEILPWRLLLYVLCTVGALLAIVRRQRNTLGQQAEYSRRLQQEVAKRTDELRTQNRELAALNHKLQEVSVTDSLTGLWNRRYLSNEIEKELALMRRARLAKKLDERTPDADLLFLIMDVDGLKGVNDTYGHQAGDLAILQMKEILVRVCRQSDTLIRWGGDEFLLLGRQAGRDSAAHLAERIREAGRGPSVRLRRRRHPASELLDRVRILAVHVEYAKSVQLGTGAGHGRSGAVSRQADRAEPVGRRTERAGGGPSHLHEAQGRQPRTARA